jgi:hypothetical protein
MTYRGLMPLEPGRNRQRAAAGGAALERCHERACPPVQRAWASIPATRIPRPSHQGQGCKLCVPPRFDITRPVPRQGIHSRGP